MKVLINTIYLTKNANYSDCNCIKITEPTGKVGVANLASL
jgi:hypothetical protein